MSDLVNDARELMGQMKAQYEINKTQIETMNKEIEKQTQAMQKQFDLVNNALRSFRNIAIFLVSTVLVPAVIGGFSIDKRLSEAERIIEQQDHAERSEVINSVDVIIENQGDMFEELGVPPEDVDKHNDRIKDGVTRAMGEVTRTAKTEK